MPSKTTKGGVSKTHNRGSSTSSTNKLNLNVAPTRNKSAEKVKRIASDVSTLHHGSMVLSHIVHSYRITSPATPLHTPASPTISPIGPPSLRRSPPLSRSRLAVTTTNGCPVRAARSPRLNTKKRTYRPVQIHMRTMIQNLHLAPHRAAIRRRHRPPLNDLGHAHNRSWTSLA